MNGVYKLCYFLKFGFKLKIINKLYWDLNFYFLYDWMF